MNTALYSELLSKCPALAARKHGFFELKERSSGRQYARYTLVVLNG